MTCRYIQALIKALPVEELQPEERRRVNRHVDTCSDCRTALLKANALDSGLRCMPDAEPPAGLARRIMARTAQIEESPVVMDKTRSRATRHNSLGWGAMFGGAAISFGTLLYAYSARELPVNWKLPDPVNWNGLLEMPDPNTATLVLVFGLCLYIAGFVSTIHKEES